MAPIYFSGKQTIALILGLLLGLGIQLYSAPALADPANQRQRLERDYSQRRFDLKLRQQQHRQTRSPASTQRKPSLRAKQQPLRLSTEDGPAPPPATPAAADFQQQLKQRSLNDTQRLELYRPDARMAPLSTYQRQRREQRAQDLDFRLQQNYRP